MFIVNIIYIQPPEVVAQHRGAHRSYLDIGYKMDFLIASGPKATHDGGVLISQLKDRETLQSFIEGDPFYINKIGNYEITEFDPVKYHEKFVDFI